MALHGAAQGIAMSLNAADWLLMVLHFLSLSLITFGGVVAAAPDMHRYLVDQQHWLSDPEFNSSITLAQIAPGPNVLFVAIIGWTLGVQAGGGMAAGPLAWAWGVLAAFLCLLGILGPSGCLTLVVNRWGMRYQDRAGVRAFKAGMAPLLIALMFSTGWLLLPPIQADAQHAPGLLLTAASVLLMWKTRIHVLWLLAAGAVLGLLGWV
jgi:chromate transporter